MEWRYNSTDMDNIHNIESIILRIINLIKSSNTPGDIDLKELKKLLDQYFEAHEIAADYTIDRQNDGIRLYTENDLVRHMINVLNDMIVFYFQGKENKIQYRYFKYSSILQDALESDKTE